MIGKDTCFCFTIPQSKIIAKDLQKGLYSDSILAQTEYELETLKEQKLVNDTATNILQIKIKNQGQMISNKETALQMVTGDLLVSKKHERSQLWQKRLFAFTTFIALSFAIIK